MATKLKNFSHAWYIKFLAYVLIAVMAGGVLLYVGNRGEYIDLSNLSAGSYEESWDARNYLYEYGDAVAIISSINPEELDINNKEYWNFPETEENTVMEENNSMVTGEERDTLTEVEDYNTEVYLTYPIANKEMAEDIKNEIRDFYNVWWTERGHCHLTINHDGDGNLHYNSIYDVPYSETVDLSYDNFIKEHPDMEKQVIAGVLRKMESQYERAVSTLSYGVKDFGLVYEVLEAQEESEEIKEKYTSLPVYMRIDRCYVTNASVQNMIGNSMGGTYYDAFDSQGKIGYIGMSEEYYAEQKSQWEKNTAEASNIITAILFGTIGIFIVALYLFIVTGRRPEEEGVHLYPIDKIWSEVQWTIGFCIVAGIIGLLIEVVFGSVKLMFNYFVAMVIVIVVMGLILLACILSQIRLLKARKWLDSFIFVRIIKKCIGMLKRAFVWFKKWMKRIITGLKSDKIARTAYILAIVLPILSATWIGVPIVIAFLCFLIYHYLGDFLTICGGAREIRNGDIHYKIKIKNEEGILKNLAEDINELSEGLKSAVSNELRSERLKAELISNVSHDLKTPLTSIVTYVDLLKQEEIDNETAKDYIEVIDRKAKRLTILTNDLFEAAKASSGAMPVNIETVDLNALVRQALGEFDEKLEHAELNVRLFLPDTPSYIKADGRLTWRVIDNLLNNVVKYGQTGSRVYVEVKDCGETYRFTVKNISAFELNIPADELMERFKRGDESRNSEGSGLGLSIANSLIDLQHGSFKISIDGDLFKAEFELPKSI